MNRFIRICRAAEELAEVGMGHEQAVRAIAPKRVRRLRGLTEDDLVYLTETRRKTGNDSGLNNGSAEIGRLHVLA